MDVAVRRENFISTNFGVSLEQHANTIVTDHEFLYLKNLAVQILIWQVIGKNPKNFYSDGTLIKSLLLAGHACILVCAGLCSSWEAEHRLVWDVVGRWRRSLLMRLLLLGVMLVVVVDVDARVGRLASVVVDCRAAQRRRVVAPRRWRWRRRRRPQVAAGAP